jgi:peroxiredoxin
MVLAVVFVVAAGGKLIDLRGARTAVAEFGVPELVAPTLGTVLPLIELAAAVALVFRPSAQWGGALALALLLAFIAGMANALRKGEAPDCHCFGAIHSAPVSWRQIVRNAALAAVAVFVIGWGTGPALDAWVSDRSPAELVAVLAGAAALGLLALAVQQWLLIRTLRTELADAQSAAPTEGLRIGVPAPAFTLPDVEGQTISLDALRAGGKKVLLMFMSAGCGPCEGMLPEMERLRNTVADHLTIGLVGRDTIYQYAAVSNAEPDGLTLPDARARDERLDRDLVDLVEVFNAYRLKATPSAVVVNPDGTIATSTVNGHPAIEALLRLTLDERPYPQDRPERLEPSPAG